MDATGIEDVLNGKESSQDNSVPSRTPLSLEDIKTYIDLSAQGLLFQTAGIFFLIASFAPAILSDRFRHMKFIGSFFLLGMVAMGVAFVVLGKKKTESWSYINKSPCSIDPETIDFVCSKKNSSKKNLLLMLILGALFELMGIFSLIIWGGDVATALLFLFIGMGAALASYSTKKMKLFNKIIHLNDSNSLDFTEYKDPKVEEIMSVYWLTVTCIYLSLSFLTFSWAVTWVIWPVAAVVNIFIKNMWGKDY